MRRLVIVAVMAAGVASLLGGCTMWKEPKVATWKNTTSVEAMERLLWQEIQAGNWVEVEARLASNFTASTAEGVLDKAQMIARWKANRPVEVAMGEVGVTDNGETTVVTYTVTLRLDMGGRVTAAPMPLDALQPTTRRMSVWQKQKDGYVLIAHAEGGLAPEAPKM